MGGACSEQLPSLPYCCQGLFSFALTFSWGQLKLPDVSLKEELRAASYDFVCLQEFVQLNFAFLFSPTSRLGQLTVLLLCVSTVISDPATYYIITL